MITMVWFEKIIKSSQRFSAWPFRSSAFDIFSFLLYHNLRSAFKNILVESPPRAIVNNTLQYNTRSKIENLCYARQRTQRIDFLILLYECRFQKCSLEMCCPSKRDRCKLNNHVPYLRCTLCGISNYYFIPPEPGGLYVLYPNG